MPADDGAEVGVGQHVAVEGEERLAAHATLGGEADRPGGAERLGLDGVLHRRPAGQAVAEHPLDGVRQVAAGEDHALDARGAQAVEEVQQERPPGDGQHRLRPVERQRAQPGPLAAHEDDGDHLLDAGTSCLCGRPTER